jgi:hypothetical protein
MGHVKEGLDIVRASRNRYDGRIRIHLMNMNVVIGMQEHYQAMVICRH